MKDRHADDRFFFIRDTTGIGYLRIERLEVFVAIYVIKLHVVSIHPQAAGDARVDLDALSGKFAEQSRRWRGGEVAGAEGDAFVIVGDGAKNPFEIRLSVGYHLCGIFR